MIKGFSKTTDFVGKGDINFDFQNSKSNTFFKYMLNGSSVEKIGKSFFKDGNKLGKRKSEQVGNHHFILGAIGSGKSVFVNANKGK